MAVTKRDLQRVEVDARYKGHRWFLHCPNCGGRSSATADDYFQMADDAEFICNCGTPLRLVYTVEVFHAYRSDDDENHKQD